MGIVKDRLEELIREGKSTREIGKAVGKSQRVVRYWLDKYGLKTSYEKFNRKGLKICGNCGEKDQSKFHGRKAKCKKCESERVLEIQRKNRERMRKHFGDKCSVCGFDKYKTALAVHHLDPSQKDPNFSSSRNWKWERIEKELKGCILVCNNCHAGIHEGSLTV